jgi:hypothetical protein
VHSQVIQYDEADASTTSTAWSTGLILSRT